MTQTLVWTPPTSGTLKFSYTVDFDKCSLCFDTAGQPVGFHVCVGNLPTEHPLRSSQHSVVLLPFEQCEYTLVLNEAEKVEREAKFAKLKDDLIRGLFAQ